MIQVSLAMLLLGFFLGVGFTESNFSKRRKKHEALLKAKMEEFHKKDDEALESFKKQYNKDLADYRKKLNELYYEEYLIKGGRTRDDEYIN